MPGCRKGEKIMATAKNKRADRRKITALYCRLSVDDDNKDEESNSITNQKADFQDYAAKKALQTQCFL